MEIMPEAHNHIIITLEDGTKFDMINDHGKLHIKVVTSPNAFGLETHRIDGHEIMIQEG